jgi:hypothetical protein
LERSLSAQRGGHEEIRQEHDEAQERNGKKDGNGGLAHVDVDRAVFHNDRFLLNKSNHLHTRYIKKSTFARVVKDSESVLYDRLSMVSVYSIDNREGG